MPLKNEINPISSHSLAGKLAWLYGLTTFCILFLASSLLYWSVHDHLQKEHQSLLTSKINAIKNYFTSSVAFSEKLNQMIDVEHHHSLMPHSSAIHPATPHHVFVRISNEQGELLIQSPVLHSLPSDLNFPRLTSDEQQLVINKVTLKNKASYLLGSTWATHNSNGHQYRFLIQAMLELAEDDLLLSEYQNTFIGVLLLGVIASAVTGFWVTRRGLKPLRNITEVIQKINAQQLNEQVSADQWPREIALLAQAFNQMLERLDRSFGQLSQFSADLAHELRTPINNLMGQSEVMLSRQRNSDEYRQTLESNLEEFGRLAKMIDELLFLAKAEDPKTIINRQHLNLEDEFQTLNDFYQNLASEYQVTLTFHANQITLNADPRLLRRALSNLISNAFRYVTTNGIIIVSALQQKDTVVLEIRDNGAGIREENLPHLFDRFFRGDKSRHRESEGSGLGLAIVKSIMTQHGGQIKVNSQLTQGSQFKLIFPLSSE